MNRLILPLTILLLGAATLLAVFLLRPESHRTNWQGAADCLLQHWNPYLQSRAADARMVRYCVTYGAELADLHQVYEDPAR